MERDRLINILLDLDSDVWLDLLTDAFDVMSTHQRDEVFGWFYQAILEDRNEDDDDEDDDDDDNTTTHASPAAKLNGNHHPNISPGISPAVTPTSPARHENDDDDEYYDDDDEYYDDDYEDPPGAATLREVEDLLTFSYDRLMPSPSGRRRRPVTPRDSNTWFANFSRLMNESVDLTRDGEHVHAVACFGHLELLLEAFERNELPLHDQGLGVEILSVDLKLATRCYIHSLARTCTPREFAELVAPLVERDTITHTRDLNVAVLELASPEQRDALNEAQREALLSR